MPSDDITPGNFTFDGANSLKYDAENRLNPVTGWVYSYDGDGHRVEKNNKGTITYYWYDDNFKVIATTGNYVRDYVYFNGKRVAYYSPRDGSPRPSFPFRLFVEKRYAVKLSS